MVETAPHEVALNRLLARLAQGEGPFSLRQWREQCGELRDVPPEHWLIYSAVQLQAGKHKVRFIVEPVLDPMVINEMFYDVEVLPPLTGARE